MDLVKRAKELGIRGNLANWKEETLKKKIAEAEKKNRPEPEDWIAVDDISEKEVEAIKEKEVPADMRPDKWKFTRDVKQAEKEMEKEEDGADVKYLVQNGKVKYRGKRYVRGETFMASKHNLDKRFEVIKV